MEAVTRIRAKIGELTAAEEARLRSSFPQRLKAGSEAVDAAIGLALAELHEIDRSSVEYAVRIASLFTQGEFLLRRGWARLMPALATIRPILRQGRRSDPLPPPHFGDMWPHQRLGHQNWRAFVEADKRTIYAPDGALIRGPGLAWTAKYEADLFRGWQRLRDLVEQALPGAKQLDLEDRLAAEAEALGAQFIARDLGNKTLPRQTISTPSEAEARLAELSAGKVGRLGIPSDMTIEALAAQLRRRFKDADRRRLAALLLAE